MATIAGYHGLVRWPGKYTHHVHAWSIDYVADALEDTAWEYTSSPGGAWVVEAGTGGDGWRTYIVGLQGWTGSYECYLDKCRLPSLVVGTETEITLYVNYPNHYFHGLAIVSAISVSAPIEGIQTVTVNFQGNLRLYRECSTTTVTTAPATTTTTALPSTTTTTPGD